MRRWSLYLALVLSASLYRVSAAENADEAARDLRLRMMNKVEIAAQKKTGKLLRVDRMFRSGMVLQRDRKIRVEGTAAPGSEVKLNFAGQQKQTRSDAAGNWQVELKPMAASNQPQVMKIVSGKEQIVINDVLIGEVWLVSGQSNMVCSANLKIHEYKTRKSFFKDKAPGLIARMEKYAEWNEPEIRFYALGSGAWKKCVGKDAMACSLVAMYFARKLHQTLKVPIGLVSVAYGCASIETFIPLEALEQGGFPEQAAEGKAYQEIVKKGGPAKLAPEKRHQLQLEHCLNPLYRFCRSFVGKDNQIDPKNFRTIEWHMSVVKPGAAFLSSIVKVLDYPYRGVIWYQGETNVGFKGYELKQKLLLDSWRKLMKNPDLSFHAVMVVPREGRPEFWAQQYAAAAIMPGTALINTADTPPEEQFDYHPSTKDFIGERLALAALNLTYGKKNIVYSGPVFDQVENSGSSLLVSFRHGKGLHTVDGKAPLSFEVAGKNKKFVPASAVLEGEKIRLSAAAVPSPKYARYAWAGKNNGVNVVNGDDQPMYPFDTSDPFFQSENRKKMHE